MDVDLLVVCQRSIALLRVPAAGIAEVSCRDALANAVVIIAAGVHIELVAIHQRDHLFPDILRSSEGPGLNEVLVAPRIGEAVVCPSFVDLQQRTVISLRLVELRLLLVRHGLLILRSVEYVLNAQHGHDRHDLIAAPQVHGSQQHLRELRLHGELSHLAAHVCEEALVVQTSQSPKGLHSIDHGLDGRRVHEVEAKHVVNLHRLEQQHYVGEVCPLNLWHSRRQHLIPVGGLRVESVALPRACATSSTSSLTSIRLAHRGDKQGIHAGLGIVELHLGHARIHNEEDPIDCQRGLRNVGGHDALSTARWRGLEDHGLHLGGQGTVDREDDQRRRAHALQFLHPLVEDLARSVDLLLTGQEDKNVAGRLSQVDLQDCHQGCLHVILLGVLRVENLHGEGPARNREDV
mmetsp:Transcript_33354/g.72868  ORF Transcript_33354/g.72868 Transcript_33354/m.72868 type:complete len:406 (-) Transcript_33354:2027-3244(-)